MRTRGISLAPSEFRASFTPPVRETAPIEPLSPVSRYVCNVNTLASAYFDAMQLARLIDMGYPEEIVLTEEAVRKLNGDLRQHFKLMRD